MNPVPPVTRYRFAAIQLVSDTFGGIAKEPGSVERFFKIDQASVCRKTIFRYLKPRRRGGPPDPRAWDLTLVLPDDFLPPRRPQPTDQFHVSVARPPSSIVPAIRW